LLYAIKKGFMAEVKIIDTQILSDKKYTLKMVNFEYRFKNGKWEKQGREVFDHGNAASALLYNKEKRTVILVQQFRIATYLNKNNTGILIETCAGLLEENEPPEESIKREIEEETGFVVNSVNKVTEVYTSAGSLTELLYLYTAEYSPDQRKSKGGGLEEEGEELDVLEIPFDRALEMVDNGEIKDAKTIILLQHARLKQLL
jgi:nudix-type nucleoside diphosphatase (YffH/AdpP family)